MPLYTLAILTKKSNRFGQASQDLAQGIWIGAWMFFWHKLELGPRARTYHIACPAPIQKAKAAYRSLKLNNTLMMGFLLL